MVGAVAALAASNSCGLHGKRMRGHPWCYTANACEATHLHGKRMRGHPWTDRANSSADQPLCCLEQGRLRAAGSPTLTAPGTGATANSYSRVRVVAAGVACMEGARLCCPDRIKVGMHAGKTGGGHVGFAVYFGCILSVMERLQRWKLVPCSRSACVLVPIRRFLADSL